MPETFPRWGYPEVNFLTVDASAVESALITGYEAAAGRPLAPADPVRVFLLSVAAALIELRSQVNIAAQSNLLTYARGSHLEALGAYFGVSRLPAAAAQCTLRFEPASALSHAVTIPAGTRVSGSGAVFATLADATLEAGAAYVDAAAACSVAGAAGNGYVAGEIATLLDEAEGIASAQNVTASAGGSDVEDDAALAERIRMAPSAFSVAGPAKAYMFHARSVSADIMDVSVETPEPGYVNVYLLAQEGALPSAELVAQVQEHLASAEVRPLTDCVTVSAPEAADYAIRLDWYVATADRSRAQAIQDAVAQAVESYRAWQQGAIGRDIAPEKLIQMVMAAGAGHIQLTDPQTGESSFSPFYRQLSPSQVAQCSGVEVNYLGVRDE